MISEAALIEQLFVRLAPLPAERVTLSALLVRQGSTWVLTHASLLIGPAAMGSLGWGDWGRREGDNEVLLAPSGLPPTFAIQSGDFLAVRDCVTVTASRRWLASIAVTGLAPPLGALPSAVVALKPPRAPVLARPGNETPASDFVTSTVRPVTGFLFRADALSGADAPEEWSIGGHSVALRRIVGIDAPTDLQRGELTASPGLLLGRVSRRAWISRLAYRREEEQLHVSLRMERARADPYEIEVEIREYVEDDLADSRRLRLADIPLPANLRGRLTLRLPTLGRGLKRTVTLYHRDGELLDARTDVRLVESVHMTPTINGRRLKTTVIGERRPPAMADERMDDLDRVEAQYDWWLSRGVRRRIVSGWGIRDHLARRLRDARETLYIIDSYFGVDPSDYDILRGVAIPVRILTGIRALPPPPALGNVLARGWKPTKQNPIPWHDRFYLWGEDSGINVGTSPNGLAGRRLFRVDELSGAEARALRSSFALWWTDARARAL